MRRCCCSTSLAAGRCSRAEAERTGCTFTDGLRGALKDLEARGYVRKAGAKYTLTPKGESYFTPQIEPQKKDGK